MTRDAFNALLKTLEEPPPATTFVLVTTEPNRIPAPVQSRCMEFRFNRLTPAEIENRLLEVARAESVEIDQELIRYLAVQADGGMRDALVSLELTSRAGISSVNQYQEFTGELDWGNRLLTAARSGELASVFAATGEAMRSSGDVPGLVRSVAAALRDELVAGNTGITQAQAMKAFRVLWGALSRLGSGTSGQAELDLVMALVSDAVGQAPATPSTVVQAKPQALSLAQMMET